MKKFLTVLIVSLIFCNIGNAGIYGRGEIKLSPGIVNYFIDYIKGGHKQTPVLFFLAVDGSYAHYWMCSAGQGNCVATDPVQMAIPCEEGGGVECKVFARNRTIRWKTDKNPGKGSISKFNSRWSRSKIINKLEELGFID